MNTFAKLNLKEQNDIVIVNAPESFEREIASLKGVTVRRSMSDVKQVDFSLTFATKQKEVDSLAKTVGRKAAGDVIVWIAYPKKSSKKYTCEFNRDSGWPSMGEAGFEPVRMVAIDEDWSALRFRRAEFIKNMTRPEEYRYSEHAKKASSK
ncbi:MAG TPA: hypothetical protein VFP16_03965 [Vicinamibacterales bacterium]|nr:hypothetical protein [Vicinamibacterales bacterium]